MEKTIKELSNLGWKVSKNDLVFLEFERKHKYSKTIYVCSIHKPHKTIVFYEKGTENTMILLKQEITLFSKILDVVEFDREKAKELSEKQMWQSFKDSGVI